MPKLPTRGRGHRLSAHGDWNPAMNEINRLSVFHP
ncbi:unnamed protein product, partial [marine sediment metagenome]